MLQLKTYSGQTDFKNRTQLNLGLQETHFTSKDTHRLKMKGYKIFHANGLLKEAAVAIFLSRKIDLKSKAVKRSEKPL